MANLPPPCLRQKDIPEASGLAGEWGPCPVCFLQGSPNSSRPPDQDNQGGRDPEPDSQTSSAKKERSGTVYTAWLQDLQTSDSHHVASVMLPQKQTRRSVEWGRVRNQPLRMVTCFSTKDFSGNTAI